MNERSTGHVEAIAGCMFSGKSEELIRRLRRAVIARQRVQVFKPALDVRCAGVRSRDDRQLEATTVDSAQALREALALGVQVVGIDEAQFFADDLAPLVTTMADAGVRVIVAGLDMDFLGQPFDTVGAILARADYVDKLHAICMRCGAPAQFSQRLVPGSERLRVGDSESYEARCRRCFEPAARAPQRSLDLGEGREPSR